VHHGKMRMSVGQESLCETGFNIGISGGGIYEEGLEIASCCIIYIQIFMNIHTFFQVVLRFRLNNFGGCNIGINDGREL
jgi:hypothetical protein